ncbi:MAG: dienelactone hydrolase family protein [Gemmatimonas sp.]|nr:dienelactone hydrolase family protein [Gemmatimonas sp.]
MKHLLTLLSFAFLLSSCTEAEDASAGGMPEEEPAASAAAPAAEVMMASLPADAEEAMARLESSPRHGEWVTIDTGAEDSVRAYVVYPERTDPAPVVLVVHEIFGLSHWVRAVADQFAAEGFIAIAPDLLTMRDIPAGEDGAPSPDVARSEIQTLDRDAIHRQLMVVAEYGMDLPAAADSYGIVGFCWGGTTSFEHAIYSEDLGASVVYYGTTPDTTRLESIEAPVLGLYGGDDERVNATIPAAESTMDGLGKEYQSEIYPGAGHGFLRAQDGQDGANLTASEEAWPRTVEWFRTHLGS